MDKAQFEREKERGVVIAIARQMLRRKLITQEEYQKLAAVLAQKHHPRVSSSPESAKKLAKKGVQNARSYQNPDVAG